MILALELNQTGVFDVVQEANDKYRMLEAKVDDVDLDRKQKSQLCKSY